MRALSNDLVSRIIYHYQNSTDSLRKTAMIYNVGKSSVWRWCQGIQINRKEKPSKINHLTDWIKTHMISNPWIRLKDMVYELYEKFQVSIGISSLSRLLKKVRISYKKMRKVTTRPTNNSIIKEAFKIKMRKKKLENIISFDEVGFQLEMYPLKGWSTKGERCYYSTKKGGRQNFTGSFLISTEGIVHWTLSSKAMDVNGMINFFEGIDDMKKMRGKILVMDNLRVHHNENVRTKIEEQGIEIEWIPPYSPALNPVEEMFSWLKRRMRYERISNEKDLRSKMIDLIEEINKKGLLGYFTHAFE